MSQSRTPPNGFLSLANPSVVGPPLLDYGAFRTVVAENRGRPRRPTYSVLNSKAYAKQPKRERSHSLGTNLSIDVSERKAALSLEKLEKYIDYDNKWRRIRSGESGPLLSFSEFPWPNGQPVERGAFLNVINKENVETFLYDPLRLHVREIDKSGLMVHEKQNWIMDRGELDRRLMHIVVESDRYLVREAHTIIALYVRCASDDDELIERHRDEMERGLRTYPSPPPVIAWAGFSLTAHMRRAMGKESTPKTSFHRAGSAIYPDSTQAPAKLGKRFEPVQANMHFFPARNTVRDELMKSHAGKKHGSSADLERSESCDSLFSQNGPIIFSSSPPIPTSDDMEQDASDTEKDDKEASCSYLEPPVPTQPIRTEEDEI